MVCSPKGSSMVKVHRECVIAKALEGLIVVAVHVAHEEVEDGEVDQVKQSTTLVIRVNVSNNVTVVGIRFPLSFSALVVAATPRVPPSFPWRKIFGRKKRGKTSLEHVGAAADGVRCVAVVRTLAKTTVGKSSFGGRVSLLSRGSLPVVSLEFPDAVFCRTRFPLCCPLPPVLHPRTR